MIVLLFLSDSVWSIVRAAYQVVTVVTKMKISAQPAFTESIRSNLKKLYDECPFTLPQAEITTCMFQNDANLIGALSCFLAACQ